MSLVKLLNFNDLGDERGTLFSLEENKNIPFDIKRVYYMTDLHLNKPRGFHAHRQLSQVVICMTGSCRFLLDNGHVRESVTLNNPNQGLLIENMTWREMHDFEPGTVLVVIASNYYDEADYVRDYELFKKLSKVEI